jgi:indolepyruvate ferredoxin oxidoreductase
MSRQLAAEGATRIVVVTDEPEKYAGPVGLASGVRVEHRDDLDRVQRELREVEGTSILIYDQTCAAEKRRRRKRKIMVDPPKRVIINEQVCEGCGDCSKKSNCLSVVPVETEYGRKRRIDQSTCNKDFSCVKGFCPSFVTVHGGQLRKPKPAAAGGGTAAASGATIPLADPVRPGLEHPYGILVTGIGGTGVVTIGAILGMAAHIEGKGCSVLDQAGLAQKGGAVTSHIRIASSPDELHAVRIAAGGAKLVIGCDLIVAASGDCLSKMSPDLTSAVINDRETITSDFTRNADFHIPTKDLLGEIAKACGGANTLTSLDATGLATALMGDSIATNLFMLGAAYQKGFVPVSADAIEQAIELNGVAVAMNTEAFRWGRRAAADLASVTSAAAPAAAVQREEAADQPSHRQLSETLDEAIGRRVAFLTDYQDAAYAARYRNQVEWVRRVEGERAKGRTGLTDAVARNYFKLLAYKDEYEVARLYTDGTFLKQLRDQFEGDYKLEFHLAPPMLAETDPATGEPRKKAYGPWMLKAFEVLARMKRLRGTRLDPFGRSPERKLERQLITDYEKTLGELLAGLNYENHGLAVEIANIPERIRGYGPVKDRHLADAKANEAALLDAFRKPAPTPMAAE